MREGVVVRAYSGYYYVQQGQEVISCKLRGRFKKERFSLFVGDHVQWSQTVPNEGVIEEILPRQSLLKRPPIANIDQVILVFAAKKPDLNLALIDRFLLLTEASALQAILCINKTDLLASAEQIELEQQLSLYQGIGYPVHFVSTCNATGIEALKPYLSSGITVFAGPSGVGKSSILNALHSGLQLKTGQVSEKIGRGKHTTRYAQLLAIPAGGLIVDTPGFSQTDLTDIEPLALGRLYPEFREFAQQCRFNTCLHDHEPDCAVKAAVQAGRIAAQRYDSYQKALYEIKSN